MMTKRNEAHAQGMQAAMDALDSLEYPEPTQFQDAPRPGMCSVSGDAVTIAYNHVRHRRAPECDVDDPAQRLWTLAALASVVMDAQAGYPEVVQQARGLGATWEQIGAALGMTKQAAHERFSESERRSACICKWDRTVKPPVLLLRNIHPDCPQHNDIPQMR